MTTIACYNFNNVLEGATVYDDVGAHNGSVVGSVPIAAGPISQKARTFSGSDSNYISIPSHADFTATVAKTFEVWFNVDTAVSTSYRVIMWDWNGSSKYRMTLYLKHDDATQLRTYMSDGSNVVDFYSPTGLIVVGSLYYAAVTWNPTTKTAQLFVNGVCLGESTNASIVPANMDHGNDLLVGAAPGVGIPWRGKIHALRWSNVVKTPKQIYDTYMAANVQESS